MSPSKNLYIADADMPMWEQAERIAKHSRQSLSNFVVAALRRYLPMDIRVVVDPAEAASVTFDDVGTPILKFGRHDPYGIGWLLWYPAPGGGSGTEIHFIPDSGYVPIEEARAHLRRVGGEEPTTVEGEMEKITVEVGDPPLTVGFIGRWLVEPDSDETRTELDGYDAGAYWGVALTKRGRIAVYLAHCNEGWPARLNDYDGFDDAARDVPADIIARAAAVERIVWRDI